LQDAPLATQSSAAQAAASYTLGQLVAYMLRLGTLGFGGPVALVGNMYRDLVRLRGATLAGLAFLLPSFVMVVALGAAYVAFGGIGWMQAVFYGVGAAVIGIIVMSAWKLTSKNIGKDSLLWAIFLVSAAVTMSFLPRFASNSRPPSGRRWTASAP
jgi:chromate transporter